MPNAKLLALPLLTSTLAIATGGGRDWWRSDFGKVTEHREGDNVTCTLVVKSNDDQVRFMWNKDLPLRIIIERPEWDLPPGQMWPVSVRIGDTWLVDGIGGSNIPALTGSHALKFLFHQPIDGLLDSAQQITVRAPDRTFDMTIPQRKMRQLVRALRKCLAQMKRAD